MYICPGYVPGSRADAFPSSCTGDYTSPPGPESANYGTLSAGIPNL